MNDAVGENRSRADEGRIDTSATPAGEEWIKPEVTKLDLETAQLTAP